MNKSEYQDEGERVGGKTGYLGVGRGGKPRVGFQKGTPRKKTLRRMFFM